MAKSFRALLAAAIAERGPLCAGIDPSRGMLERWGLEDTASGAAEFAMRCLDAFGSSVAALKPNAAFFEQYGSAGVAALESLLASARSAGILTIADAKRGDIDSTNAAYARAWLDVDSPLSADALTVSPYLGERALAPFFDAAQAAGRGVFVVVRSSNREGRDVQLSRAIDGRSLEAALLDKIAARSEAVGAVIGLIAGEAPLALPEHMFYLVPGLWTQGATVADLHAQFGGMRAAPLVVNLSRSLAEAGPDPGALREAARRASSEIFAQLRPLQH